MYKLAVVCCLVRANSLDDFRDGFYCDQSTQQLALGRVGTLGKLLSGIKIWMISVRKVPFWSSTLHGFFWYIISVVNRHPKPMDFPLWPLNGFAKKKPLAWGRWTHFGEYFSDGLKPPTSFLLKGNFSDPVFEFCGGFFPQKRCPDFFSWDIFVGVFLHKEKNFYSPLCLEVNWAFTKFLGRMRWLCDSWGCTWLFFLPMGLCMLPQPTGGFNEVWEVLIDPPWFFFRDFWCGSW